jgi:hypothetical protein
MVNEWNDSPPENGYDDDYGKRFGMKTTRLPGMGANVT